MKDRSQFVPLLDLDSIDDADQITRYLKAMRCPPSIKAGQFGLWEIERRELDGVAVLVAEATTMTLLWRHTDATIHLRYGELVMEDGGTELRKHLPAVLAAKGRILVSGLGLGCVLRGLLANAAVEFVTVIERDQKIIDRIWPLFAGQRTEIIHADAATWEPPEGTRFDLAWHDCWTDTSNGEPHLALLHSHLMLKFINCTERQGAWEFPRQFKRRWREKGNYLERA